MPDIILRLTPETLERIDTLKARIELQERHSLPRSAVLLRILDAGCAALEMALEEPIAMPSVLALEAPITPATAIASEASISTIAPIAQASSGSKTQEHPDLAEEVLEMLTGVSYDAQRYKLGKLCPRGHEYEGTGQSLLYLRNSVCVTCDKEKVTERRRAKRG